MNNVTELAFVSCVGFVALLLGVIELLRAGSTWQSFLAETDRPSKKRPRLRSQDKQRPDQDKLAA